jgi:DNA-binding PadR family transcriptional regulator
VSAKLNATAASLLGFLHEGPLSGWDLVAVAQERLGDFWSLSQSQVYRELAMLAEAGMVVAGDRESRERRPYQITEAGKGAFAHWVRHTPATETIRIPLLLTVAFGRHLPPKLLESFMAKHRILHEDRLAAYRRQREAVGHGSDPDGYLVATIEFGIAYEEAVIGWLDRVAVATSPAAPSLGRARPGLLTLTSMIRSTEDDQV